MRSRGFTLLECMIALGLLAVGGLATAHIITLLTRSTTKVESSTDAVALANLLLAQINDARFFSVTNSDPGLTVGGPYSSPITGSTIDALGPYPAIDPTLLVSYEVVTCARCDFPFADGQVALGGVDVIVTVDNHPNRLADRKLRGPIHFFTRKEYAPTNTDPALIRGW